jgi:hypothetical protein
MEIRYSEKAVKQLKAICKGDKRSAKMIIRNKANSKSVAVIMDYREYLRLKELAQDKSDYLSAAQVKTKNKRWVKHSNLKKELGL